MTDADHPARAIPSLTAVVMTINDETRWEKGSLPPNIARRIALNASYNAYTFGRRDALAELKTTQQVAEELGVSRIQVFRLSRARNLGWELGRERFFRPEDIEAMRDRPRGRLKTRAD